MTHPLEALKTLRREFFPNDEAWNTFLDHFWGCPIMERKVTPRRLPNS